METSQVLVVGVGRIGAVTAVGMAHLLHDVCAIDIDERRIVELCREHLNEAEPGLRSALKSALRIRHIEFLTSTERTGFDVAFLCVDTPAGPGGAPDMRQVFKAAEFAVTRLRNGGILVTRATVPPGTGDRLTLALKTLGRGDVQVAHVPEFLRESRAWEDFREPDRIVIGANSGAVRAQLRVLFEGVAAPIVETDRTTAELAKYAANAFLATSISFANEIAELSQRLGADASSVFDILKRDKRIGPDAYLTPGLGFGGHCLPKDTAALEYIGAVHGVAMRQLSETIKVNHGRVTAALSWLRNTLAGLEGRRCVVVGLAFKPSTDDLRESPALRLVEALKSEGATVIGYDSLAGCVPGLERAATLLEGATGADALVLAHGGGWPDGLLPEQLAAIMNRRVLYDPTGALARLNWQDHRFVTNFGSCDTSQLSRSANNS